MRPLRLNPRQERASTSPAPRLAIAVNGRTGETMGSIPVQHWKLLLAAITVGTFLEGIALWILGNM